MNFKRYGAALIMAAMVMTQGTAAMASEFTDFIVKNEIWSYADMKETANDGQQDVLGATRVSMPCANGIVLSKADSCIRVVENGNIKRVMPANINIEKGTYSIFSMCPGNNSSGMLVFANELGQIGTIGNDDTSAVKLSKNDSRLLYSMAKSGDTLIVQA